MDDQRSEILVPRGRAEVDGDAARFEFERPGIRPTDVVSRPSRRSRLRWLFWVLLVLAIIGAVVWYYHGLKTSRRPAAATNSVVRCRSEWRRCRRATCRSH